MRGEFDAAEAAYRDASRYGWEPQPGLALLRLAQGNSGAAAASIRRVVGETAEPLRLRRLLPAYVEIMLAVGDTEEASAACSRLEELSADDDAGMRAALATQARGAVQLEAGDAETALVSLRRAWQVWQEIDAPYEAARARVLLGLACRALGDEDAAALELEAARGSFAELGGGARSGTASSRSRAEPSPIPTG